MRLGGVPDDRTRRGRWSVTTIREEWLSGVEPELAYWHDWLSHRGYDAHEEYLRMISPHSIFQYTDGLPSSNEAVQVLDVGAGPITKVGKIMEGRQVIIKSVDYLAHAYNIMLKDLGIISPVMTEFGLAERLSEDNPEDFYDVVVCSSALDHVRDPVKCLSEMLSVCKPGGHLFVSVQRNEGERNNYDGFHNWNFDRAEDGRAVLWNRYARFDLAEMYRGISEWDVHYTELPDTTWIGIKIKKVARGNTTLYI